MSNHRNKDIDDLVEEGERTWRAAKRVAREMFPGAELNLVRYATEDDSLHSPDGAWLSGVILVFDDDTKEETLDERAEQLQDRLADETDIPHAEVRVDTDPRPEITIEVPDFKDPRI